MKIILSLALVMSFSAFSSVSSFDKRFKLKRDSAGTLKSVKINIGRSAKYGISVKSFWMSLKQEIHDFQNFAKNDAEFEREMERIADSLRSDQYSFNGQEQGIEGRRTLRNSLKKLKSIDLKAMFAKIEKSEFLAKFQVKLKEAFTFIDPTMVARPDHSSFFYKRNVGNQVVKWALDFVGKRFSSVPVLNSAIFVVKRLMVFVADQRSFHQNIFLYYAQTYSPAELGLTKSEVDTIVSSIFESRISLTGYGESKAAQANWMEYGFNKFYKIVRQANARKRSIKGSYGKLGKRLGYAFSFVENAKGAKIVNLLEKAHMFTSNPSVAFNFAKPAKVLRERTLIYLAQYGLSFLPIPGIIKSAANSVANSFYVDQGKTEGALVGYFEDKGEQRFANILVKQSVNPFIFLK